jgi:hypothetical protein
MEGSVLGADRDAPSERREIGQGCAFFLEWNLQGGGKSKAICLDLKSPSRLISDTGTSLLKVDRGIELFPASVLLSNR